MIINHISVSRTGCFEQCQQQYKYRYHLQVIPDNPEQIYFTYGKLVHKAAEVYVENKGKEPIHDIVAKLLRAEIPFEGNHNLNRLDASYHKKLYEHTAYIEKFTAKVGFDGEIEHEVRYDLDPPNGKTFLGFIDRLIIKNSKAIILDYKTSKKNSFRKKKSNIGKDLQLNAYALYVWEKFNIEPSNITAALVYLENPEVISTSFTIQGLKETKEKLKKSFYLIENFDPNKVNGNVGFHCRRCDYNNICAFYRAECGLEP